MYSFSTNNKRALAQASGSSGSKILHLAMWHQKSKNTARDSVSKDFPSGKRSAVRPQSASCAFSIGRTKMIYGGVLLAALSSVGHSMRQATCTAEGCGAILKGTGNDGFGNGACYYHGHCDSHLWIDRRVCKGCKLKKQKGIAAHNCVKIAKTDGTEKDGTNICKPCFKKFNTCSTNGCTNMSKGFCFYTDHVGSRRICGECKTKDMEGKENLIRADFIQVHPKTQKPSTKSHICKDCLTKHNEVARTAEIETPNIGQFQCSCCEEYGERAMDCEYKFHGHRDNPRKGICEECIVRAGKLLNGTAFSPSATSVNVCRDCIRFAHDNGHLQDYLYRYQDPDDYDRESTLQDLIPEVLEWLKKNRGWEWEAPKPDSFMDE